MGCCDRFGCVTIAGGTFLIGENFSIMGVSYKTDYNTLVYGGILLVIMLFLPDGLAGGSVKIKNSLKSSVIKTRKSA